METYFWRLKERVAVLGNHNQKYVRLIELHLKDLIERLEGCGKIDQVHLWTTARNLATEMDVVLEIGESEKEKREFLGAYFAIQFLHLNLRAIDVLMLDLTTAEERLPIYQKFMLDVGTRLRSLIATYMAKLLDLFLPAEQRPEFVICGVGTRTDQDDLDIGIIDDGSPNWEPLNAAISKLSSEMFKRAVGLHMHISEHVGGRGYSAAISEYKTLLDREIHDFVIISEMLNAAPIYGSERLFREFQEEVTSRYYYQKNRDNKYHEGYLRGILGEVRSLLIRQMKTNRINLKNDALRMIKGGLFAGKTIFGVKQVNCWAILHDLWKKDRDRAEVYFALEESLTFLEIFRYLYQLFVVQEEEIYLDCGEAKACLARVAKTMGYEDVGVTRAEEHLLIHYYEYVHQAKRMVEQVLPEVTRHLRSVTVFSGLRKRALGDRTVKKAEGHVAVEFVELSEFFRGTKFWDDLLDSLEEDDAAFLIELVRDLCSLDGEATQQLVKRYAEWGKNSFIAVMSLMVMLGRHKERLADDCICDDFNESFLKALEGSPDEIRRLTRVFSHYPELVNSYLFYLREDKRREFAERVRGDVWDPDVVKTQNRLLHLCQLHIDSSEYFKRFIRRVIDKHPSYLQLLDDLPRLQQIAEGLYGDVDRYGEFQAKKEKLGDYFDLEFFRVGMLCLSGAPSNVVNAQFTEFSDRYLRTLFDICEAELDEELGKKVATKDLLAIFVSGGHAREQAFVDDYDMMFLLDSDDEAIRTYGDKIASRMNTQIIRRGILPHFRFADLFGHYVTRVDELDGYLSSQGDAVFVDKSQVLGSRMIVGSQKFQRSFIERIIKPHVFQKADEYIGQMIAEISARQKDIRKLSDSEANIKEGIGGMRDIEMTLLICKARYRLEQPVTVKLLHELEQVGPDYRDEFVTLMKGFDFFERLRSIYRLTASAEDELRPQFLHRTAEILGFDTDSDNAATERLLRAYRRCTFKTGRVVKKFMREFA